MAIDNPPKGTAISVRNITKDIVGTLYKADVCGLPNAVIDIMPDKMSGYFKAPVDKVKGTGRFNGRYYVTLLGNLDNILKYL